MEHFEELGFFIDQIIAKLQVNSQLEQMIYAMTDISHHKEEFEMKYLNASSNKNKEVSSLKRIFKNEAEKNNFISLNYSKYPIKTNSISLFLNDLKGTNNSKNELDVRIIILYEINKRMMGN